MQDKLGINEVTFCCVCGSATDVVQELPDLPLTDTYIDGDKAGSDIRGYDQALQYCPQCGHGQLQFQLQPDILYGKNYFFRTSLSATARKGTEFFISTLNSVIDIGKKFSCILDVGCNDLYLLNKMENRAQWRIGIDPIWQGQEQNQNKSTLKVIGERLENVREDAFPQRPDLVFCRHTLEHVMNPRDFISHLLRISSEDAVFVFEFPGFDALVCRLRFDQVFHQHLQYFSVASFRKLLSVFNCQLLKTEHNYHDWGATAFVFKKSSSDHHEKKEFHFGAEDLRTRFSIFKNYMLSISQILDTFKDGLLYGYGAAQMLPVIGYHLKQDFSDFSAILDDDSQKDGLGYWNLPVRIKATSTVSDLCQSTVLLTAVDNVQVIMPKLLNLRPLHIINPLTCA
jgi:SAM-dependent methyltransferase